MNDDNQQQLQNDTLIKQENIVENQEILKENDKDNLFTYYLSSDLESYNEYQEQNRENDKENVIENVFLFFIAFVIQFMTYIIYVVFIPIILFRNMFVEKRIDYLKERLWAWISLWSIMYLVVVYFRFNLHLEELHYLLQDEILFIFTTFLVFSYMRAIDVQSANSFSQQFEKIANSYQNISQLIYFSNSFDKVATQLDYNSKVVFKRTSLFPSISTHYSLMSIQKINKLQDKSITNMISSFNDYLSPNFKHFLIQIIILSFKVICILLYILKHSRWQDFQSIFHFLMICMVYIYIAFNLNRALGNNDIRKKILQMKRFNNYVDYSNINYENYKQKLDVTCPISLQTWDTARKFILGYKKYYLQALEISYLSLIFYYLLVIIICLSAYFQLEWLVPKGSQLLKPVVVIISTFNFIYLSVIFLLRFKMGTKYNKSFQKLLSSIQYLQNITSDLNTMYSVFFLQNPDSANKENRFSAYGMITKRVKLMSNYYIEAQILFKDRLFKKEEKQELRRQMLQNMQNQLQNIKQSILLDEQLHKYKLLNFLEINSNDFLITLFLGLASTLPTIIPVFISYFKN
ncbi:hypothetical protein ABPG74_020353 [Tetrahymena malaccensis]